MNRIIFSNYVLGTKMEEKVNMKKTIKRSKLAKALRKNKIDSIVPFKEKPSDVLNKDKKNNEMEASELFSLFTADIIKKDVDFVR